MTKSDAVNAVYVCVIRDDGAVGAGSEVIYMGVPEAPRQPRQYVQQNRRIYYNIYILYI